MFGSGYGETRVGVRERERERDLEYARPPAFLRTGLLDLERESPLRRDTERLRVLPLGLQ